ncbi:hypothetical protein CB0940_10637 [Cercospora beticola]|uniref:Right handed beta helix domain-containing protein n=1 Tax=Cercospora beticola TaxID=122368 RepID=A0A2G5HUA4_CERBT|nr:hypothetical protein CB0940_10637 [Cercospora beticola]PIA95802.1 hypothetical protein CB0940_10637 [Cercospora beticola]WPB07363.1 hypothetical protein RHO25_012024 [Cercospora beticola]CAK1367343.1 unnamed protein product [Cercospora beticola]
MKATFFGIVALLALGIDAGKPRTRYVKARQSIQKAIDAASPGDCIHVAKGTYNEQLLIKKDGITLIGHDAQLAPPSSFKTNPCTGVMGPDSQAGICIAGKGIVLDEFIGIEHRKVRSVQKPVKGVSVSGFKVRDFIGANILVLGAEKTRIDANKLENGGIYGFLAAGSKKTTITNNKIKMPSTLGFIALCVDDFRDAQATGNHLSTYGIGLCVQTNGAQLRKNFITNSCAGAFVDPFTDGAVLSENTIEKPFPNCPNGTVGIIIDGATNTKVTKNIIKDQVAAAGLVIVDDPCTGGGLACSTRPGQAAIASNNVVKENVFQNNAFDIFINSTGTGNVAVRNQCTSPPDLCAAN